MQTFGMAELYQKHPKAYAALPEAYQSDSVLEFWEESGRVFTAPIDSEVGILDNWTSVFDGCSWIRWA